MQKRTLTLLLAAVLALCLLAGCGQTTSTNGGSAASGSGAAPADDAQAEVDALYTTFAEVANLGDTIDVTELDLRTGGLWVENIEAFKGGEVKNAGDNGGIVVVAKAAPGKAAQLATEFEAFRDSRINDAYAEFATAMENTRNARIATKGDLVIYAVSATGHEGGYNTLDSALADEGFQK